MDIHSHDRIYEPGTRRGFDGKEGTVSGVLLGRHPSHGFTRRDEENPVREHRSRYHIATLCGHERI